MNISELIMFVLYILLMLGSIGANYLWGRLLGRSGPRRKLVLTGAV